MQTVAEPHENTKPLLTPDEFWEGMQKVIGRNSLYGLIQAGRIKHIRVGRKILIPRSELTDFPVRESEAA
jgi:excisionase family DNA binding protein